jgi:hypothetical protein
MTPRALRIAFAALHATLGVVVFVQGALALKFALRPPVGEPVNPHVALVAAIEALGALLFLLGRTVRLGGTLMLAAFAIALAVHGVHRGMPLLVYAAGTVFVMVHGSLWLRPSAA